MSAVQQLSEQFDYTAERHDFRTWWEHHVALIRALEPAKWPDPSRFPEPMFTESEVLDIRNAYANGNYKQAELATLYGCSASCISAITLGDHYANVGGPRITDGRKHRWKRAA